jgi:ribosome-associated toxin RatA of RatAB toxin-antitoxin module
MIAPLRNRLVSLFTAATLAVSVGGATLLAPVAAFAEGNDAEAQRLEKKREAERYNVEMPGASIRAGGAVIFVDAPIAVVQKIVTDYGKYSSFMPRFQKSKVIAKKDGKTDVYLQVPILHGAATVWALTRFEPPAKEGADGVRVEGKMVDGNVDDLRAVWHLRPVDDKHTVLKCELLIVPKLPLPAGVVTPELEFAADQAVTATRDRSEAKAKETAQDGSAQK